MKSAGHVARKGAKINARWESLKQRDQIENGFDEEKIISEWILRT